MYRILELNPQLAPFAGDIDLRMERYHSVKKRILSGGQKKLADFANAHHFYGFHHADGYWIYREWAPNAQRLYLEGDFNEWDKLSHPLSPIGNGNWEIRLEGDDALWEGCRVKTVVAAGNTMTEHIPLFAHRVVQDKVDHSFTAEITGRTLIRA